MAGLWSRAFGAAATPLQEDLRRITDQDSVSLSVAVLDRIAAASRDAEDRKAIMGHLRQCLGEDSGSRWRRILGGLHIVEHLLAKGDRTLFTEAAAGLHFDLGMRLGFLSKFEYSVDPRVQEMVRGKAGVLREAFVAKIESAGTEALEAAAVQPAASAEKEAPTRQVQGTEVARRSPRRSSRSSSRSSRSSSRSSRSSSRSSRSSCSSRSSSCSSHGRRDVSRRRAEKQPQPATKKAPSDSEASTASSNKVLKPAPQVDLLDIF